MFYTVFKLAKLAFLCAVILQLTACSLFKEWRYLPDNSQDEQVIYVTNHGWHTGIVIDGNRLGKELSFLEKYFGRNPYYELGWGDSGFYTANEITTGLTVRAVLWPTPSVMHVVALQQNPVSYFKHSKVVTVTVSKRGYTYLLRKVTQSFARGENGQVILLKKGLYGDSLFFKANGSYYLANTCNTWTAKVLDSAGVPVSTFLTLTASGVIGQVQRAKESYRCC